MSEIAFSNREITELFRGQEERSDAFHSQLMQRMDSFEIKTTESLKRIEMQTIKTNGSVAEINKWRERANGGAIAASFFMSVVVIPILAWSIYTLVNVDKTVHRAIDDALSAYEVTTN